MTTDWLRYGVVMTEEEYEDMLQPLEKEVLGIDVGIAILESLERIEKHLRINKEEDD